MKHSFKKALNEAVRGAVKEAMRETLDEVIHKALDTEGVNAVISDMIEQDLESSRCFLCFEKGMPEVLVGPDLHDATIQAKIDLDSIEPMVEDIDDEVVDVALNGIDLMIEKLMEARATLFSRKGKQ